jgi:dephospho-CoA kinase
VEFQRQAIREKLIENAWKITELEKGELDWWASEMWLIESVWSPIVKTAYITFLVAPMYEKEVWAVKVSEEKSVDRFGESTMSLKHLKKELPEFMKFLSEIRNKK